ncbi:collagen alpha-6(VI) chain-like isoform X2 [Liolophura sinensis]|uniref:collagen alpha-6(VI) chain-like isoform X2 n=1 Tax=Liolophura sinensis TaxID=3198878 RepID=UPI003158C6F1
MAFQTKMRSLAVNSSVTYSDRGIEYSRKMFSEQGRTGVAQVLVVLRDGFSRLPPDTLRQALIARMQNITVITIGLDGNSGGIPGRRQELQSVASFPDLFYGVSNFNDLQSVRRKLVSDICDVLSQRSSIELPTASTQNPTQVPVSVNTTQSMVVRPNPSANVICRRPGDVVFILDGSKGVDQSDFRFQTNFVVRMTELFYLNPDDGLRVGVVVYGDQIKVIQQEPFLSESSLRSVLGLLIHDRGSPLVDAGIRYARELLNEQGRPGTPKILVLLSHGINARPVNTIDEAEKAKQEGSILITVGIGKDAMGLNADVIEEFRSMASTSDLAFLTPDYSQLPVLVNNLAPSVCDLLSPPPILPTLGVNPQEFPVSTSQPPIVRQATTQAPQSDSKCQYPGDLIFLLDGSPTSTDLSLLLAREFALSTADSFNLNEFNGTRVAGILNDGNLRSVPFVPFHDSMAFQTKMRSLAVNSSVTYSDRGIEYSRKMFSEQGRTGVAQVLVVLRDGFSRLPPDTLRQALIARMQNITVITIGLDGNSGGIPGRRQELQSVASFPDLFYGVSNFNDLQSVRRKLVSDICGVLKTTDSSIPTPQSPVRPLPVTPNSVEMPSCTRSTAFHVKPGHDCAQRAEIVFMVDASEAITPENFALQQKFVMCVANSLFLDPSSGARVAAIAYSSQTQSIPLAGFSEAEGFWSSFSRMAADNSIALTNNSIQVAREMFKAESRQEATKTLVILTDGKNICPGNTLALANLAKRENILIISIGISETPLSSASLSELKSLASTPDHAFVVSNYRSLMAATGNLVRVLCYNLSPGSRPKLPSNPSFLPARPRTPKTTGPSPIIPRHFPANFSPPTGYSGYVPRRAPSGNTATGSRGVYVPSGQNRRVQTVWRPNTGIHRTPYSSGNTGTARAAYSNRVAGTAYSKGATGSAGVPYSGTAASHSHLPSSRSGRVLPRIRPAPSVSRLPLSRSQPVGRIGQTSRANSLLSAIRKSLRTQAS